MRTLQQLKLLGNVVWLNTVLNIWTMATPRHCKAAHKNQERTPLQTVSKVANAYGGEGDMLMLRLVLWKLQIANKSDNT